MTEPVKIRIRRADFMRISCFNSVTYGHGCGFVTQSKLAANRAPATQLSRLQLNTYKQTSSQIIKIIAIVF